MDVGEDFNALFLVRGDELMQGIVSLAEVSAVSLAPTPATSALNSDTILNVGKPARPNSIGTGKVLHPVPRQRRDSLGDGTALLYDDLPVSQHRRLAHQHHAHALPNLGAEILGDTAVGIAFVACGSVGQREHLQQEGDADRARAL